MFCRTIVSHVLRQTTKAYLPVQERAFQTGLLSSLNATKTVHQQATGASVSAEHKDVKHLRKTFEKVELECQTDLENKKLFAVVHISGKQFKVAHNDVIMTNNKIEAECGDTIRLEKVLAVGGRNFTLLGQPLLKRDLVNVEAMVMEKTKGEKKIAFKKKRRKGYKRWKGHRQDLSVLKIKSINFDSSAL
uniref:Large ribosomal subunit protein bL21m n=1 Tax=Clytia hemisphaerica TaxID=252671 RepID=A0A7M5VAS8_9CNID